MITQLTGKLTEIHPSYAVIDCNGVGYLVNISLSTYGDIEKKENLSIFTHLVVREDAQILYGFSKKIERELFEKLISVNGVGPATALMMLSTLDVAEISSAIINGEAKTLQRAKGIGAKTAQRIIIDLKDKLSKVTESEILTINSENKIKFEALTALEVLGIPKKSSEAFVTKLISEKPNITLEEVIKQTLKKN